MGKPRVRLVWHGRAINQEMRQGVVRRLTLAGEFLRSKAAVNLSVPVVKVKRKRTRNTSRGPKGSTYTWVLPSSRSSPGEYPRAETATLLRDVFYVVNKSKLRMIFATSKKYGMLLEIYFERSFLRRTFAENRKQVKAILTQRGFEPLFTYK